MCFGAVYPDKDGTEKVVLAGCNRSRRFSPYCKLDHRSMVRVFIDDSGTTHQHVLHAVRSMDLPDIGSIRSYYLSAAAKKTRRQT